MHLHSSHFSLILSMQLQSLVTERNGALYLMNHGIHDKLGFGVEIDSMLHLLICLRAVMYICACNL